MENIFLTIHIIIAIALIISVLLQRSEGGALGIGGGGDPFMSGRGVGNFLTRTTALLALAFFVTSILLALNAREQVSTKSAIEQFAEEQKAIEGDIKIDTTIPQAPISGQGNENNSNLPANSDSSEIPQAPIKEAAPAAPAADETPNNDK